MNLVPIIGVIYDWLWALGHNNTAESNRLENNEIRKSNTALWRIEPHIVAHGGQRCSCVVFRRGASYFFCARTDLEGCLEQGARVSCGVVEARRRIHGAVANTELVHSPQAAQRQIGPSLQQRTSRARHTLTAHDCHAYVL